jgi:hypothetical protein
LHAWWWHLGRLPVLICDLSNQAVIYM